jgi:hypothetical protein
MDNERDMRETSVGVPTPFQRDDRSDTLVVRFR